MSCSSVGLADERRRSEFNLVRAATPPNKCMKLTSRLAALAGNWLWLYCESDRASAAKAPARSLCTVR